jgi:hypothetical protein
MSMNEPSDFLLPTNSLLRTQWVREWIKSPQQLTWFLNLPHLYYLGTDRKEGNISQL